MHLKKTFLLLLVSLFFSCENNEIPVDTDNLLIGYWQEPVYNNDTITFKRGSSLPNEAYGVSFDQAGGFIERTSGWCGTPPLTFFNIEGVFEQDTTLINIATESYPTNYTWRIIRLTEDELVVKKELSEQEVEYRSLMDLFNEIQELSSSVSCSDATNWLFTAYGAKACGGSQGYIAYSSEIDTNNFLNKIEIYTEAEKTFNVKWGIISDCSIGSVPVSVECENGIPTLKY